MADKKISALTAATLPLAGSEVLPIVQSGSTVKVSSDNLTVKNVRSNATSGILQVAGPAAAATRVMTVPDANFTAARTDAAQSFTGNQTVSAGNFVVGTAGKGIDFSANTNLPGMTSELLNWYEEGNWTPSQGGQLVVVGDFSSEGRYTRIGRVIHFTGYVAGTTSVALTAVGQLTSNLPYNTGNTFLGVAAATNNNSSQGSILSISITSLYNVTTISATPKIYFSGTYII